VHIWEVTIETDAKMIKTHTMVANVFLCNVLHLKRHFPLEQRSSLYVYVWIHQVTNIFLLPGNRDGISRLEITNFLVYFAL
jgi:hypothetical protein